MVNGEQSDTHRTTPGGLQVPAVPWSQIESWPIENAGLPRRIVTRARLRGYRTVGELRRIPEEEILQWRSIGIITIQKLHNFLSLCDTIARGNLRLTDLPQVFSLFLDQDEINVLVARYNLNVPFHPAARPTTLQEIGRMTNRTRERIRQVEETAVSKLRSQLARTCLEPFYTYFQSILTGLRGSAECNDIMENVDTALFGDFNPCAVLALFCDLHPSLFTRWRSVFSLLNASILAGIEQRLIHILSTQQQPLSENRLVQLFSASTPLPSAEELRAAPLVARSSARILTTIDLRHLLPEHLDAVIAQRMERLTLPAHFRDIARAVNEILVPSSRVGAGIVLRHLNSGPRFLRVDRGLYTLAVRSGNSSPAAPPHAVVPPDAAGQGRL